MTGSFFLSTDYTDANGYTNFEHKLHELKTGGNGELIIKN